MACTPSEENLPNLSGSFRIDCVVWYFYGMWSTSEQASETVQDYRTFEYGEFIWSTGNPQGVLSEVVVSISLYSKPYKTYFEILTQIF